ncbi:DNA polymerase III subunit delta [Sediminibacillus massiliensis]|uniref:DNA polymerase III subunit delta n=1 Tax=Sediminibacillus massiliensis TaxID=1926277 RepID=UPI000988772A|nr:DNA polymerase III subunit delta [Sediminibacillus massiliensis]
MSYFETIKDIRKKKFSPVYLFYGTESYLIQDLKQQLVAKSLNKEDMDTSVLTYDLEETSIQEVIEDAETYPFLSERKVIFAYNPVFLKAKPDKVPVEHNVDVLQSYLLQPAEHTLLVFVAPYEKLDERKKITKLFKKHAAYVACQPVKEWDIPQWIKNLADESGISVDERAFDLIGEEIGSNLLILKQEIDKMALFVGEGGIVTKEIADKLVSHNSNTSGLKLVDAVIEKDLNKAIHIFKDLQKSNEEPIALIALLASQFRTIFHVKLMAKKGYSQNQMAQQLKVHPYVVKMSQKRERSFHIDELKKIMDICTETDSSIKQGKTDKILAFELLLYQLIHIKKAV